MASLLTRHGLIQVHFIPNNKISFDNHALTAFNKIHYLIKKLYSLPIPPALNQLVQAKYFHLLITSVYYLCFTNLKACSQTMTHQDSHKVFGALGSAWHTTTSASSHGFKANTSTISASSDGSSKKRSF